MMQYVVFGMALIVLICLGMLIGDALTVDFQEHAERKHEMQEKEKEKRNKKKGKLL